MNNISFLWKNIFKFFQLSILGAILFILSSLLVPQSQSQSQTQPAPARSASSFINSIGVAVHINYIDTAYGKYNEIVKPRLQELGIRHIRDGVSPSDMDTQQKFNDLATLGIKSTLVMDPRGLVPSDAVNIAKNVAPSIEAVEGPNEWDVQPDLRYKNQTFPEGVRLFQSELYQLIKDDPATANLDVLSPSMAYPENAAQLTNIACDFGNMHSYAGGGLPSDQLETRWIPNTQKMCGNKPIIATECGWHNALRDDGAPQSPISEEAAAKYVSRLYLEYFNRGIKRAFLYELIDPRQSDNQDSNFGLLRYDGSPKPAFNALKNLLSILNDSKEDFPLESLDYTLTGETTNVHKTILQKSNGRFYLILWQEVPSFNTKQKIDISVEQQKTTLTLNTPIREVYAYLPIKSTNSVWQTKNTSILPLNIPDEPLILELIPG